ncbi:MAG: polysaccharide deacetylase family protein [Chloroflexi bacterium]|nr:polysaccharide deacetylase family protein [Chloroflexota bacterium]
MPLTAAAKAVLRQAGLRRSTLAAARMCCERHVIARAGRPRPRSGGRILCYHSVGTPLWGVNDVAPRRLRAQIERAFASGCRFVPAEEIARTGGGPHDLALTFDDGLASVLTNGAPLFAEYGIPWTLFVVSDWAEGRHTWGDGILLGWRDVERAAALGATIGSHSVSHPNFALISEMQAQDELGRSRETIAARLGITPASFAIPLGQSGNWPSTAGVAAHAAGYELIYAQSEARRSPGTVPRTFVTRWDDARIFDAALAGKFDRWEEWV